ncbi:hypothetical protein ACGP04_15315 [Piscirickettsia salmonis]
MLGDFASLDVQNTYRGSDAYEIAIAILRHTAIYNKCLMFFAY